MRKVLLPESVRRGDKQQPCIWNPADDWYFTRLQHQTVVTNLVREDAVEPRGVSNPWSPAVAFQWQLDNANTKALNLLELLLLAIYLKVLEEHTIKLKKDDESLLRRVLARALNPRMDPQGVDLVVYCWPVSDAVTREKTVVTRDVIAASCGTVWPLFPATSYAVANILILRDRLLRAFGPGSPKPLLQADGDIARLTDPAEDRRFREVVRAFATDPNRVDQGGPWRTTMMTISRIDPTREKAPIWSCPHPHDSGRPWAHDDSLPPLMISLKSRRIECTRYPETALKKPDGKDVVLEDLGATVMRAPNGQESLVVWQDGERHQNLYLCEVSETSDFLVLQYMDGPRIRLEGRLLRLKDVLCTPTTLPAGATAAWTLPIRREFLDLVQGRATWIPGQTVWEVTLRGRNKIDRLAQGASETPDPQSGVIMWPREDLPDNWSARLCAINLLPAVNQVSIVERRADGKLEFGESRSMPLLGSTKNGRVAFICFGKDDQERGVLQVEREAIERRSEATRAAHLAIDLGTSNSVVAYRADGDSVVSFVPQGTKSVWGECETVCRNPEFGNGLQSSLRIFSRWHEAPQPPEVLATLLVEHEGQGRAPSEFSIIPREKGMVRHLRPNDRTKIHTDLKWQDITKIQATEKATEAYLERMLLPAFKDLSLQQVGSVTVSATHPLAFDVQRLANLKQRLAATTDRLAKQTGIKVAEVRWYSESEAGAWAAKGLHAYYKLTVDMGGGTTDIAILDLDGKKVLAADSLQIGCRKMIRVICRADQSTQQARQRLEALRRAVSGDAATDESVGVELLFETLLQSEGINGVVAAIGQSTEIAVKQSVAALLAAIAYACHKLLDIALPRPTDGTIPLVGVGLLGQGWHLFDPLLVVGFSEDRFLGALSALGANRWQRDDLNVGAEPLARKKKIVEGALLLSRAGEPALKPEMARYVGMDLACASTSSVTAGTRLADVHGVRLTPGDPGVGNLVQDLLPIFNTVCDGVGDPATWLNQNDPAAGNLTFMQTLLQRGVGDIKGCLTPEGQLQRSPLLAVLSGAWVETWTRR